MMKRSRGCIILHMFVMVMILFTVQPILVKAEENTAININETNFPDEAFRNYILNMIDTNKDKILSQAERDSIVSMDVSRKGITSLKGVEYFANLDFLSCSSNQLKSLDISKNIVLKTLYCFSNQLTGLDVSKNVALQSLSCNSNQLTSLDVSKNIALQILTCNNNQLTGLDVSKNVALQTLSCSSNQLTGLDVSKNVALQALTCSSNQLASLDVSQNVVLNTLDCYSNLLTSLLVSQNVALQTLSCSSNQLTSLDFSKNVALRRLTCNSNQLTSLDFNRNVALTYLECSSNQLVSLDFSKNVKLEYLWCYSNQLTSLYVSQNVKLLYLSCHSNRLTSLDVNRNVALKELHCYSNQLASLCVSQNVVLQSLYCDRNQLTSLDVSKNVALIEFECNNNQLTSLDVSQNVALQALHCDRNQLTSLDVSQNVALHTLYCYSNQLTNLDISQNVLLHTLYCDRNQLTSLDVSQNVALQTLSCFSNQLTNLDISQNVALKTLFCTNNHRTVAFQGDKKNTLDLASLKGFDVTKVSNLNGAVIKDNTFILNSGSSKVTYTYDIGNNYSATFILNIKVTDINETNFPDETFRKYVLNKIDEDNDGILSLEERDSVVKINVKDEGITTLQGIEYFTKLEELYCDNNQLASLDISQNVALKYLSCQNNQRTVLFQGDILDLSSLKGFDVTKVSNLKGAVIKDNTFVMNSGVSKVTYTYNMGNNYSGTFILKIKIIDIDETNFPDETFRKYVLSEIDQDNDGVLSLEERDSVIQISVPNESITTLQGIEYFIKLEELYCNNNQLTSLDISQNTVLKTLKCQNNQRTIELDTDDILDLASLKGFDVTKVSNLKGAVIEDNTFVLNNGVSKVTYTYDMGNNYSETFTLTIIQKTTETPKPTETETPIQTPESTQTPTQTPIPTSKPMETESPTQTPKPTETINPTQTPEPTETETPIQTPEPTGTETPTQTPEPTKTENPTQTPESTETEKPIQTPKPTETETPTQTPEPTETENPTQTPGPMETETPTQTPEPTETENPIQTQTPKPIETVTLSKVTVAKVKKQTYTGKKIKPSITVKYKGIKLKKGTDYTIKYSNNKNIGTATITITGKGKYKGTKKTTFTIVPKKVTVLKSKSNKPKTMTLKWKKAGGKGGYQIVYSKNSKFKTKKTVTTGKTTWNLKKLTKGKKYYVKIRAYKKVKGKKVYGSYSKVAVAKVK